MANGDSSSGATTQCEKTHAKLTVVVKSSADDGVIKGAQVTLKAGEEDATFPSSPAGKVNFFIKNGTYSVAVTADNKGKGQKPAKPFKDKTQDDITVAGEPQEIEVKLDPVPMVKVFLKAVFKDPDDTERGLPLPKVTLEFEDASTHEAKFNEDGMLLGEDGKTPGLDVLKEKKSFVVKLGKPDKPTYAVCEGRGQDAAKTAICVESEVEEKAKTNRVFLLPHVEWGLDKAKWTVSGDDSKWSADEHKFKGLESAGDTLGTAEAPVKLLLDMRWQFARFTYYDRILKGDDQVSSLPLLISGYAEKPPHAPSEDKLTTRCNWTIGDDEKAVVQCIPWILFDSTAEKPDKDSELRFTTKEHTFIKTAADKTRTLEVGAQATASAERIRFYDLPQEWRSRNWFLRKKSKGTDITDGKFGWELDTSEKVRATKDAPWIYSLDDIVLYKADGTTPLAPLTKKNSALAVFHHTFKKGGKDYLSEQGLYLPEANVAPRDGQSAKDTKYPASKVEVLGRKSNGDAHAELKENYVVRYPDWTRVVTCAGNLYDVFSERSVAKDGEDRVVGARAGVAWIDATAQIDGKDPVPTKLIANRPQAIRKPFFIVQPYAEMLTPIRRKRRVGGTSGADTTAVDLGPLGKSKVGRTPNRASEWQANQPDGNGIGRWDVCLLRCADLDADDPKKEVAVLFQFFRISVKFMPSCNYNTAAQKAWMKRCMDNLDKRWNGPDGDFNPGRAIIEPQKQEDAPSPLKIEVFRFFQMHPDAQADFRFQVISPNGGRNWMNCSKGLSETSEGKEVAEGNGRFTAAHEMGHGGGLLDDYFERSHFASYWQPGVAMLVPGDPYVMDDVDGAESMMKANKEVRARHFWHLADWLYVMLGNLKLQVIHGKDDPDPYRLPHHPRNANTGRSFRSYLMFPYDSVLDASLPGPNGTTLSSRFDTYLWLLGKDVYSETILPGKSGGGAKPVDGILVVCVNMGIDYLGVTDHDWIRSTTSKIVSLLHKTFSYRCVAKLTLGGHEIKRCVIHISPRIIVGTHAGDDKYDKLIGAKPVKYQAGKGYSPGTLVHPSGGDAGFWYEASNKTEVGLGPGQVWVSNPEPAWPASAGNTVDTGNIRWTAMTAEDGKKKRYGQVIEGLVEQNQLHVVAQIGTADSEVTTTAGELPRIKIKSGDLVDIMKAVKALGDAVRPIMARVETKRGELIDEINDLDQEKAQLKIDHDTALLKRDQADTLYKAKKRERLNPLNWGRWSALTQEINTAHQTYQSEEGKRSTAETQWTAKRDLRATKFTLYQAVDTFYKNEKCAKRILKIIEKAKDMAQELFKDEDDPMTCALYTKLVGARTSISAAATGVDPDRTKCLAAVPVETTRLKAALEQLPDPEITTPNDYSNVASAFISVAEKIHAFANAGANAAAKFSKAKQAKTVLTSSYDAAKDKHDYFEGNWVKPGRDIYGVNRHATVMRRVVEVTLVWSEAAKTATIEEQIQQHFATYMGLEIDKGSTKGYDALVKPFADAPDVKLAVPPPAPPRPVRQVEEAPEDPPPDSDSDTEAVTPPPSDPPTIESSPPDPEVVPVSEDDPKEE